MRNIFKGKINTALLIVRIIVGIAFFLHGLQKFNMGIEAVTEGFVAWGIPLAGLMAWVVTLVETVGGIALIVGVGTELVSFLLIIVMIVAAFVVRNLMQMDFLGGWEVNLVFIAALIPLLVQGAGRYSLSHILMMMKHKPEAQY
ncbi:MAG: DoxX family protein [Minisyncoccia bacterium]